MFKPLMIFLSGVCLCLKLLAQSNSQDKSMLYWRKDRKLQFADFQGKPKKEDTTLQKVSPKMSTHKLSSIIISIDVDFATSKGKTVFTIRAGMKKDASWIKERGDTIALKHEQGHFDICEIYARMLRRDIRKAKSLSAARAIYDKVTSAEEKEHDHYDIENTFEAGGIKQVWNQRISSRLKELEPYEQTVVTVAINK